MSQTTQDPGEFARTIPLQGDMGSKTVGQILKARREQLGWALPDIAGWLCIRQHFLEALEEDRFRELPGNTYALGFLRAYSDVLGLNVEDMTRRFKRAAGDTGKPRLKFPTPQREHRIPASLVMLLGVAVVALAYVGWYKSSGQKTQPQQEVAATHKPESGNTTSPQIASITPQDVDGQELKAPPEAAAPPAAEDDIADGAFTKKPIDMSAVTSALHEPVRPRPLPVEDEPSGLEKPAAKTDSAAPPPDEAGQKQPALADGVVVLRAVDKTWVQVQDSHGKTVYERVMQPGEEWSSPASATGLKLTVGNAGGLVLRAGAVTTPPLGARGAVRRGIALSAPSVINGDLLKSLGLKSASADAEDGVFTTDSTSDSKAP